MAKYFVSGIGTDVGKTIVSAILTEALKADYWKPVQTGSEEIVDREVVQALVSNSKQSFILRHIHSRQLYLPTLRL